MSQGVWLETLSWVEAKSRFDAGAIVLMSVGAIAKEHGAHLPLNTDWLIARALAQRVAEALPIVVAPVVSTGYYPVGDHFYRRDRRIDRNLIGQGARRIALLNTGVSTEAPLRIACRNIWHNTASRSLAPIFETWAEPARSCWNRRPADMPMRQRLPSCWPSIRPASICAVRLSITAMPPPARPASSMSFSVPAQWRQPQRRLWRPHPRHRRQGRGDPGCHGERAGRRSERQLSRGPCGRPKLRLNLPRLPESAGIHQGPRTLSGPVAEWPCRGLQIPVRRFDSGPGLQSKSQPRAYPRF
jgi:hypothetical protein